MVLSTISKRPSMMISTETADVPFGYIIRQMEVCKPSLILGNHILSLNMVNRPINCTRKEFPLCTVTGLVLSQTL